MGLKNRPSVTPVGGGVFASAVPLFPCIRVAIYAEAKTEVSASRRKNKSGCDIRANPDIAKLKAPVYGQGQPDGGINRQCRMLTTDVPWLLPFRRSRAKRSVRTGKQVTADLEPCVYGAGSDELKCRQVPINKTDATTVSILSLAVFCLTHKTARE